MANRKKSLFIKQYGWLAIISSLLLISLTVMSQILQNASQFAQVYTSLLFASFVGIAVLFTMLVKTLQRLKRNYRNQIPGSKMTSRLTFLVSLIIGVPLLITYFFSITFVNKGIDQWFDIKTDVALTNAVKLVKITLDDQTRNHLKSTLQAADQYQNALSITPVLTINKLRKQFNIREAALYTLNGELVAYSSQTNDTDLPKTPSAGIFQQIRNDRTYAAIETLASVNQSYQIIRIMVPVYDIFTNKKYALQAVYPIPDQLSSLADTVRLSASQYKERSYLKTPLKTSFTVVLTLLLLLTLVSAILFTIQMFENMVRPLQTLAKGTKAVAEGDYSIAMPVEQNDEMGQLVQSFNDMIQQIARARNEIKFGHQQAEVQKLYLQAIIKNLKSGVLTLDKNMRLKTINDASNYILNADFYKHLGKPLSEVLQRDDSAHLNHFFDEIIPYFNKDTKAWSEQFTFNCKEGEKILLVHGSTLPSLDQKLGGYVIVIEDITALVQAQLHAAWRDVAKRLAHEIKNPLTPIQLSAERLHYKLEDKLDADDQKLLGRMTDTIIEQVNAMQNMVQAFTEYADTPDLEISPFDINALIKDITSMYQDPKSNWQVRYDIDPNCHIIHADAYKLRQLLHNLIKNGIEATENTDKPLILVTTQCLETRVLISVSDNGPGIPEKTRNWIFEPYATDKPKGTGLGLAIVKKIVDEHQGQIQVESELEQGTKFIITLPLNPTF
ncbi:sensor histidine kinase [Hydrogenovibrio marinus]|uniref:histidine kinase n=1 Tax=Hydrogenovibrio marinus TaxID=28885 RepID=A0A066ZPX1_HYDMR|nr:ATP-binding protein [Hydrogenovibrio marinus]KDN95858.1 histidine kinase [Hydrogenovibrio marinus]BBN58655.1 two-component sensor histidine kinase [Hydrogenovibrio marinus]